MGDLDWTDFGNALLGDATSLAGTATAAGSQSVYGDITGMNLAPVTAAPAASAGTNQLLMLAIIGLLVYYLFKKGVL